MDELIGDIGHDGSEIWWPDLGEPWNRRGFDIQEFIDVADNYGVMLVHIRQPDIWDGQNLDSVSKHSIEQFPLGRDYEQRIDHYMRHYDGLIVGMYAASSPHMTAWNYTERAVYDPAPHKGVYQYDHASNPIFIQDFIAAVRIKSAG